MTEALPSLELPARPERSKAVGCAMRWLLTCALLVWCGSAARMFALMAVCTAGPFVLLGLVGALLGLLIGLPATHVAVRTGKTPARNLALLLLIGLGGPAGALLPWEAWGIQRAVATAGGSEAIVEAAAVALVASPGQVEVAKLGRPLRALQPRAARVGANHLLLEVYGAPAVSGWIVPARGFRATAGEEVAPGVWWISGADPAQVAVVPR